MLIVLFYIFTFFLIIQSNLNSLQEIVKKRESKLKNSYNPFFLLPFFISTNKTLQRLYKSEGNN